MTAGPDPAYELLRRELVRAQARLKRAERERDTAQAEAERLKNLKLVFFAAGDDPAPWLTGFHANVRAAEIVARDSTPQSEYYGAGAAPLTLDTATARFSVTTGDGSSCSSAA